LRPKASLDVLKGCGVVLELGRVEDRICHGRHSFRTPSIYTMRWGLSSVTTPIVNTSYALPIYPKLAANPLYNQFQLERRST
jgi:hypothetical protein